MHIIDSPDTKEILLHKKHEDYILKKGVQKLVSNSKSFEFLKEEEELYTLDDLKVRFK